MIATQDLAGVSFLASVSPDELARLAQGAGDIRLGAGDSYDSSMACALPSRHTSALRLRLPSG